MKPLLPLLCLVALAACDETAGTRTDPLLAQPRTFAFERIDRAWYQPVPTAAARAGDGGVVVEGRLTSPSGCAVLNAYERRGERTLELTVEVRLQKNAPCGEPDNTNFVYTAGLDADPGTWTVRVVHEYDGKPWPGASPIQAQVTVP